MKLFSIVGLSWGEISENQQIELTLLGSGLLQLWRPDRIRIRGEEPVICPFNRFTSKGINGFLIHNWGICNDGHPLIDRRSVAEAARCLMGSCADILYKRIAIFHPNLYYGPLARLIKLMSLKG